MRGLLQLPPRHAGLFDPHWMDCWHPNAIIAPMWEYGSPPRSLAPGLIREAQAFSSIDTPTATVGRCGLASEFPNGSGFSAAYGWMFYQDVPDLELSDGLTLIYVGEPAASGSLGQGFLCLGSAGTCNLSMDTSGSDVTLTAAGASIAGSGGAAFGISPLVVVATFGPTGANAAQLWVNGAYQGACDNNAFMTTGSIGIGLGLNLPLEAFSYRGSCYLAGAIPKRWPDALVEAWMQDPFGFLYPMGPTLGVDISHALTADLLTSRAALTGMLEVGAALYGDVSSQASLDGTLSIMRD